jgi:hypothetical protein
MSIKDGRADEVVEDYSTPGEDSPRFYGARRTRKNSLAIWFSLWL